MCHILKILGGREIYFDCSAIFVSPYKGAVLIEECRYLYSLATLFCEIKKFLPVYEFFDFSEVLCGTACIVIARKCQTMLQD